jgi:putative Holliday junction resolvase
MRLLGIDYGTKRVGVALSDEAGVFAYPHSVIKNSKNLSKDIVAICKKENVGKIILGESLNFKGKCNDIVCETDVLKKILEKETGLPVIYENEVLSSAEAERIQGKNEMLDASAAAVILRSYIDRHR